MSDTAYLALYFDAPLQSWGYASKFDRRTTLAHPTRSGVLGLLCAALGVDRSDTQELARLDDSLGVEVYVFRLGSRLADYHTVGGGYDPRREPLRICKTGEGKVRQKNGQSIAVITHREYLEEARFGVVVSGPSDLIADMAQAVRNPVWGLWLGRKSCVPASRVFEGVHADTDSALAALRNAFGDIDAVVARKVAETESYAEGNDTLMDRPIDFAKRRFASRRIMVE
jgi:CRISPR system Cascade subunit CasD